MSTPPSSEEFESGSGISASSPAEGLAFVVHSQDSVQNSLPPDVDNKSLVRQKRRRTSPEDQKILEAEFLRHPKPDKAARMAIVAKVALGEKEVQIWFQNRRQNSRRKSRPLEPHQGLSQLPTTSEVQPLSPASQKISRQQQEEEQFDGEGRIDKVDAIGEKGNAGSGQWESEEDKTKEHPTSEATLECESQNTNSSMIASSTAPPPSTLPSELDSSQDLPSSQDATTAIPLSQGYLANRRSASFVRTREETSSTHSFLPPKLNRAGSSLIRLSMTENGLAKVVDRAAGSPSPSRSQSPSFSLPGAPRYAGLRRSYSAAGLSDLFKQDAAESGVRKVPRVPGRSRHSSNWTLFCDADVRDSKELIERAEQEASGSARDAIKMMRNTSRPTLRTNLSRTNPPVVSQSGFAEHKKQPRQPLKRASTTHGRLEKQSTNPSSKGKKGDEEDEWERPSTDSDKENWEPEDGQAQAQGPHRRRAHASLPTARPRKAVLGENTNTLSQSGSLGAMMDREKKQRGRKDVDEEVSVFLEDNATPPVARGVDLDCVASLLSLSQGAWR